MNEGYTNHFPSDTAGAFALRRPEPCAICGGAKAYGAYANPICSECRLRLAGDELGRARLALLLAGDGARGAATILAAATRPALALVPRCGACSGSGQVLDATFWDGDGPAVDCEACGGTGSAGPGWGCADGSADPADVDLDADRWNVDRTVAL